jgi:hypothetical protein
MDLLKQSRIEGKPLMFLFDARCDDNSISSKTYQR